MTGTDMPELSSMSYSRAWQAKKKDAISMKPIVIGDLGASGMTRLLTVCACDTRLAGVRGASLPSCKCPPVGCLARAGMGG